MKKILFKNARILTMEDNNVFEGMLTTKDNLIDYVGSDLELNEEDFDSVIDCEGNLLMPGFKNVHTHSAMTFLRSYADDLPLESWLYDFVFPLEAKIKKDDVYHLSMLSFLEYLTSGITLCFDMYYNPYEIMEASNDFGMRTTIVGTINTHSDSVKTLEEYYTNINNKYPLVSMILGFHAEYTATEEMLTSLSELVHKYHAPVYTHTSETLHEVNGCKARHDGLSPTKYFMKLGLYDYGGGGYHCNFFDDEDIKIFAENGLFAITCPGSNTKLASGIAPIKKFLDAGVNVAIGTDGPASNNCLDMFREMFLVTGLQKIVAEDPKVVDAYEVLKMATVNGAKSVGLNNALYLKSGQLADIIMIDLSRPNMQPINNIVKNVVYSGSKDNIKMTMINGKILYYNHEFYTFKTIDEFYKTAQEITDRLKG